MGRGSLRVEGRIDEKAGTSIAAVRVRVVMIVQVAIAASSAHFHHECSHFHALSSRDRDKQCEAVCLRHVRSQPDPRDF